MSSQIDVVNFALNQISLPGVSSVSESLQSGLIYNQLTTLLPFLLKQTDWNFALKFVSDNTPITPPTAISGNPFSWVYLLPPDYGQMDRFESSRMWAFPYRIVDGMILTNQRPIQYWYVVNIISDYQILPATFIQALGFLAASRVSLQLTKDETLTAYLASMYEKMRDAAVQLNDMERYVQSQPHNDYDRQVFV